MTDAKSYNGWPASRNAGEIDVLPLVVHGVSYGAGCRGGDVHIVLTYVLEQVGSRVDKPISGQCGGWNYRPNRNNPRQLSCHASATAVDHNSLKHRNGLEASRTYTAAQIDEIHRILHEIPELSEVVHWGGDWHYADGLTPDAMHYEIHDHDLPKLARVAARIRNHHEEDDMPAPKDWDAKDWAAFNQHAAPEIAEQVWQHQLRGPDGTLAPAGQQVIRANDVVVPKVAPAPKAKAKP